MTRKLRHGPDAKQQLKDGLYNFLYGPVQRDMEEKLKTLVNRNNTVMGQQANGFLYQGEIFWLQGQTVTSGPVPQLDRSLYPDIRAYLDEVRRLNEYEIPFVVGFITQVLNNTEDFQDYLQIFPESVHEPIQQLIHSCACRERSLNEQDIERLRQTNERAIQLMKERQLLNLITR